MPPLLGHIVFEPAALLGRVEQFVEGVGELHAAAVELETLRHARVLGAQLRAAPPRSPDNRAE